MDLRHESDIEQLRRVAIAQQIQIEQLLGMLRAKCDELSLRRHGLLITTQTLWDQLNALGRRLESASRALLARLLAEPVIGLDQTSWARLDGKGDKPWQMWCLTAPGAVAHRIRDDKSKDTFKTLMDGYKGTVVCDALKTHEAGARGNDAIALAGCWAYYPASIVIRRSARLCESSAGFCDSRRQITV